MKKKNYIIRYVMLSILLAFALTGCGSVGKEDTTAPETTAAASEMQEPEASSETAQTEAASTEAEKPAEASGNPYYVNLNCGNKWDDGSGNQGAQCDLIFYNNSNADITEWTISIKVGESFRVDNLWNGEYKVENGLLIISNANYNGTVPAGQNTPIGFIMYGSDIPTEDTIQITVGGKQYANGSKGDVKDVASGSDADGEATTEAATVDDTPVAPPVPEGKTALATYGKLHVSGTNLVDSKGNKVQLRGISTHGLSWFPQFVNKDAFQDLRDKWGVNLIRLAMYTHENGGYCTDGDRAKLEKLIEQAVKDTNELGMYVIIDWHVLQECNPKTYQSEAEKFFEKISAKYADCDNVIYEICNEPNGGASWSDVKSYAEDIIPIIRKHDKDAVIIIGTPTWSQDVDIASKDPVKGYENLMYAVHFYAATHKDDLRNKVEKALQAGLPIFISEFSICDASGNGGIDYDSAETWMKLADKYNLSFASWSLCNKAETSALIKSSCNKTSGFSEDDLSDAGKWVLNKIKEKK